MEIASLQHPLVKHWVLLRKENQYRKESKTLLLVGEKMIETYPHPLKYCIGSGPTKWKGETNCVVTEEILQKISGLENFHGVIAEVAMPEPQNMEEKRRVLILDEIQDPGNLGTILRTALALGWDGVIATPGTADFFNDKALRASQGALFHLPFAWNTPEEISSWIERKKVSLWVADSKGTSLHTQQFSPPLALVLSHEGQGARSWSQALGKSIAIPLKNNVDSLNVAAAGAILLYQFRQSN